MLQALLLVSSYLLGSLPFGLLIARWWAGIDVREHGSGNIGATNVYRVVSKPAGVVVFILDVLKGYLPPVAASALHLSPWWIVAAGLAAIFGHQFSPFLGFKGGKGVSTSLGVFFGVAWKAGLTAWAVWGIVLAVSGYVSLGSIVAAAILPALTWFFYPHDLARFGFALVAAVVSIYKHRANIQRLRKGTELGFRNRPPQGAEQDGEGRSDDPLISDAEPSEPALPLEDKSATNRRAGSRNP
jgi:glycerol-3-phosphate acyltransferase PlsY